MKLDNDLHLIKGSDITANAEVGGADVVKVITAGAIIMGVTAKNEVKINNYWDANVILTLLAGAKSVGKSAAYIKELLTHELDRMKESLTNLIAQQETVSAAAQILHSSEKSPHEIN